MIDIYFSRLQMLATPRTPEEPPPPGLVDSLPPEVIFVVMCHSIPLRMVDNLK